MDEENNPENNPEDKRRAFEEFMKDFAAANGQEALAKFLKDAGMDKMDEEIVQADVTDVLGTIWTGVRKDPNARPNVKMTDDVLTDLKIEINREQDVLEFINNI